MPFDFLVAWRMGSLDSSEPRKSLQKYKRPRRGHGADEGLKNIKASLRRYGAAGDGQDWFRPAAVASSAPQRMEKP